MDGIVRAAEAETSLRNVERHELDAIELVVESHAGYVVAEKHGQAGHIAELNDPRRT